MSLDRRRFLGATGASVLLGPSGLAVPAWASAPIEEPPVLRDLVKSGALPPMTERLPREPFVVDLASKGRAPGVYGGKMRTLIAKKKNARYIVVWGYARLVGYDEDLNLIPDLLARVENDGNRAITMHLRKGHRWSDGHPFTTEDFRYWWQDIRHNEKLAPGGIPGFMKVDGQEPTLTVVSETELRFNWHEPNPLFLPELAKARPPFIYAPAHYLKQFHADYGDPAFIEKWIEKKKVKNWAQLHNRLDNLYKFDNPALPTLQPWHNKTKGKAQRYSMERNPFFHRVDTAGRQLPYIDKVYMSVASSGLIPAKANAGEVDLQAKGLSFRDMPVLKQGEKNGRYVTHLWPTGSGSHIAIYPNLTTTDPAWRRLNRDVRFRRALSLGIDRALINETLYFGLAREGGNAAIRSSPFYDRQRAEAWAQYDPDFANALLDEIGLTLRDANKIRLLPNGQPLEIVIETAGERLEEVEALQLVGETWRELGVKLLTRPTDRDLLRNRTYSGQTVMTAWKGWDNGVPTANTSPAELAPTDQATLCWSAWGEHYATGGSAGSAPDYAPARELLTFYKSWMDTEDEDRRSEIWRSMLAIHADQQFIIGILCEAPQPVVVADSLRNVPKDGLYAWAPGAHFGIHRPDEWWFDDAERRA